MFDMNKVKLGDVLVLANGKTVKIDTIIEHFEHCGICKDFSGLLISNNQQKLRFFFNQNGDLDGADD